MQLTIIFSEKLKTEDLPSSGRVDTIRRIATQFNIRVVKPDDVSSGEVEKHILKVHNPEYFSRMKEHPFYRAAIESVRCIIKAVKSLDGSNITLTLLTASGHLAERNRMRGYCLFNGLAIAVEALSRSWGKIAVVETDAHHGSTALLSGDKAEFFCLGRKKCEIEDDFRCIFGRKMGKRYVESFKKMLERVEEYNPDVIIWYLGTDIEEREYAEMKLGRNEIRAMVELMSNAIKGRKAVIMIASGSREDVVDILIDIIFETKK